MVATHLNQVLFKHAHELIGHEEVQQLLQVLAKSSPKLAEELVPGIVSPVDLLKILQQLLQEQVRSATSVPSPKPSPTSVRGVKIPPPSPVPYGSPCPAQSSRTSLEWS